MDTETRPGWAGEGEERYLQHLLVGDGTESIVGPHPVGLRVAEPLAVLSTVFSCLF